MRGVAAAVVAASCVAGCASIFGVQQLSEDGGASASDEPATDLDVGTRPPDPDAHTTAPDVTTPDRGSPTPDVGTSPRDAAPDGGAQDANDEPWWKCEPFGLSQCMPGYGCVAEYTDSGLYEQFVCYFVNDAGSAASCTDSGLCANGLTCGYVGVGNAAACFYNCLIPGQNPGPPFDASGLDLAQAGTGGCPSGMTCQMVEGNPPWLGNCFNPGS